MSVPNDETRCLAGDIILSQVYHGWMVGAMLTHGGAGIQSSLIAIFHDFKSALCDAQELARQKGVLAWRHESGTTYRRIPL